MIFKRFIFFTTYFSVTDMGCQVLSQTSFLTRSPGLRRYKVGRSLTSCLPLPFHPPIGYSHWASVVGGGVPAVVARFMCLLKSYGRSISALRWLQLKVDPSCQSPNHRTFFFFFFYFFTLELSYSHVAPGQSKTFLHPSIE